ncbi:MAG TPA: hypothetical protein DGQ94_00980 [Pseudomonas sp.]|nr:hypothetical protein DZC31_14170 [Stenotrophomonas rhizophila]HCV37314.1 hypothetical protein [Pseudomonas sp.]
MHLAESCTCFAGLFAGTPAPTGSTQTWGHAVPVGAGVPAKRPGLKPILSDRTPRARHPR